ncbi:MAG: beta-lactamase family protein [Catenulisporales bacterium]|nr:beta-lactamase family protein [Catenulisporales bacterium]
MTHIPRRTALGMLGSVPLAAGALSPTPTTSAPAQLHPGGTFDRYLCDLAARDLFSGSVLVTWRGRPMLSRSLQMADKSAGVPNSPDTVFPLASLTKMLTGVAVVQLAQAGAVDFSAPIGTYLDGFPSAVANAVTVHQLATHTSGLQDFQRNPAWQGEWETWTTKTQAFDRLLDICRRLPLDFTPGTGYAYSNTGYFLLGAIVAKASGQPYWDYMQRRVFTPAGMPNTAFATRDQQLTDPRFAHNYSAPAADGHRDDITSAVGAGPNGYDGAGGAYSCAQDLAAFARALTTDQLLNPAWTGVLSTGKHPISLANHNPDQAPSQATLIGYGTEERIVNGYRAFGHTGALGLMTPGATAPGGGSTALTIYPDLDVVVVVLSNYLLWQANSMAAFLQHQDAIVTGR